MHSVREQTNDQNCELDSAITTNGGAQYVRTLAAAQAVPRSNRHARQVVFSAAMSLQLFFTASGHLWSPAKADPFSAAK